MDQNQFPVSHQRWIGYSAATRGLDEFVVHFVLFTVHSKVDSVHMQSGQCTTQYSYSRQCTPHYSGQWTVDTSLQWTVDSVHLTPVDSGQWTPHYSGQQLQLTVYTSLQLQWTVYTLL